MDVQEYITITAFVNGSNFFLRTPENTTSDLDTKVNEMIKQGWIPLGGVSIAHNNQMNYMQYSQAMIKIRNPNESVKK